MIVQIFPPEDPELTALKTQVNKQGAELQRLEAQRLQQNQRIDEQNQRLEELEDEDGKVFF